MPRHHAPISKPRGNPFPFWLFVGAAVLIVAALAIWFTQNADTGEGKVGPRLAVNTERIDLGKQPFDKTVRAEFKVTNTGDSNLNLDATSPIRVVEGC